MTAPRCAVSSRVRIARAQVVPAKPAEEKPIAVPPARGLKGGSATRFSPAAPRRGDSADPFVVDVSGAFEAAFAPPKTAGVAGFMAAAHDAPGDVPAPAAYHVARSGAEARFVRNQMLTAELGAPATDMYDPLARLAPEPASRWRAPQDARPLHPALAEEEVATAAAADARARNAAAPLSRAQIAAATAAARKRVQHRR